METTFDLWIQQPDGGYFIVPGSSAVFDEDAAVQSALATIRAENPLNSYIAQAHGPDGIRVIL